MLDCLRFVLLLTSIFVVGVRVPPAKCADDFIPRRQTTPPGPPVPAEEAARKMVVPEGFKVEVVAAEPDLVNPCAMTIDERGRFWVCESVEYPRSSPGVGKDRIKILEDTDGDGRVDKTTIFADGLNIPCGIAIGFGGVWVSNAPDILFLQDTDGDDRADKREVVVTGFGRSDTHELPNSLTWGPDGWLYGLNGVFNRSHIKQGDRDFRFTCAMFRIDPRTREFQLFAEGISNPWGIAFDPVGGAFVSACVIDHLWHVSETGYYHRQAGAYPPHTWKIESIVKHRHQMAAYCGLEYFDSDAYPEKYRDRLMMGNIHGGCINVDRLHDRKSTYHATGEADFLTANDAWFMPIDQQTGPDGCLYVLDWYDRYHCYQDARRDPQGIDRLHGRIYRVRYKQSPRAKPFDLAKQSNASLITQLASPNIFFRATAQRLLQERSLTIADRAALESLVLSDESATKTRMHALFALVGSGKLPHSFLNSLLKHDDAELRAWGVRAAGNQVETNKQIIATIEKLARDSSPRVRAQVAIAANKLPTADSIGILATALASGDDTHLARIIWGNLHPRLDGPAASRWLEQWAKRPLNAGQHGMMPHLVGRIVNPRDANSDTVVELFETITDSERQNASNVKQLLDALANKKESRQLSDEQIAKWRAKLTPPVLAWLQRERNPALKKKGELFAAAWEIKPLEGDPLELFLDARQLVDTRSKALAIFLRTDLGNDWLNKQAQGPKESELLSLLTSKDRKAHSLQTSIREELGAVGSPDAARLLIAVHQQGTPELRPRIVALLSSRQAFGASLLQAVADGRIAKQSLNANHLRALASNRDATVRARVKTLFGEIRATRDPLRERAVASFRKQLEKSTGDPHRGLPLFRKICGQCHKLHGEGQEVGPDITINGRANFQQLLSNVFDPNLVIGPGYQSRTVITDRGKILTGLVVEETDQRVVLKIEGGKLEQIPREQIDELVVNPLSLMPENLDKQFQPQEWADLFSLLSLDKHPDDPDARTIPGTPVRLHKR